MTEPHLQFVGAGYEVGAAGPEAYDCSGVCGAYLERLGYDVPTGAFEGVNGDIWRLRGRAARRGARARRCGALGH